MGVYGVHFVPRSISASIANADSMEIALALSTDSLPDRIIIRKAYFVGGCAGKNANTAFYGHTRAYSA